MHIYVPVITIMEKRDYEFEREQGRGSMTVFGGNKRKREVI